ncbi:MAG: hypothetical protein LW712_15430 [Burkholderiaceae bacterium]|jgi:hypothetical protein|nr:hypothetical protein [Burkholderiaceae bacterium]
MTKREQILQAIATLLAAVPGTTGVYRSREDAMSREESPAIVVRPDGEQVSENTNGYVDARLTVLVEVYARGTVPDQVADPIAEAAFAAMMDNPTLGALAIDVTEDGTDFDTEGADQDAGFTAMRFVVWHRRPRNRLAD